MSGVHPLSSDHEELVRETSGPRVAAETYGADAAPAGPPLTAARQISKGTAQPWAGSSVAPQPRILIALALIACGIIWALARGLHQYGLSVMSMIYDLDQPPVLLGLVGGWLLFRSRRR